MGIRTASGTIASVLLVVLAVQARASVELASFAVESSVGSGFLFSSIGPMELPGAQSGPGATEAWPLTLDLARLSTLPATLEINFPDRAAATLTRIRGERRGGNAFLWSGSGSDCSGLLSMAADGLKGTLSCANAQYGIDHSASSSSLWLSRYDNAGSTLATEPLPGLPSGMTLASSGPAPLLATTVADQTVDILVLFNGSMTTTNIWTFAQYAVDQTQLAMDTSTTPGQPVIAQLKLAGAARISRTVSGDPLGDLDFLQRSAEVTALRDYWVADAIVYITSGTGPIAGIAYEPGYQNLPLPGPAFAPWAIAVVLAGYATNPGDYVFAHEFAHTFGANHNADHLPVNPTPVRPWAFGHWAYQRYEDVPAAARTIMAYVNECILVVNPCPRILHYSNPNIVLDDWFHTGIPDQDNARLIAEIAPIEAQYRASLGRIFANGFE